MPSIFPSDYGSNTSINIVNTKTERPRMLVSYNVDTDTGEIVVDENGKFEVVEGLEAVKVRCWIILNTYRGRWGMISKTLGSKLKDLQGHDKAYVVRNIDDILTEALVDGIYITSITVNSIAQEEDKAKINFTVNSIYGNYEEEKEV